MDEIPVRVVAGVLAVLCVAVLVILRNSKKGSGTGEDEF